MTSLIDLERVGGMLSLILAHAHAHAHTHRNTREHKHAHSRTGPGFRGVPGTFTGDSTCSAKFGDSGGDSGADIMW